MKAQEIKDKIRIRNVTHEDDNGVTIEGKIEFNAQLRFDRHTWASIPDAFKFAKKRIGEMIVRDIFEDQSREMAEALTELRRCNPMDWKAQEQAFSKIMNCARRQPPAGECKGWIYRAVDEIAKTNASGMDAAKIIHAAHEGYL